MSDGNGNGKGSLVPDFEVVLWGYDRQQVARCLDDLTGRLEEALGQLDAVDVLQAQLCEAHLEIDQLRLAVEERSDEDPPDDRLSTILKAAEQLRSQAQRDAEEIRARARAEAAAVRGDGTTWADPGRRAAASSAEAVPVRVSAE